MFSYTQNWTTEDRKFIPTKIMPPALNSFKKLKASAQPCAQFEVNNWGLM